MFVDLSRFEPVEPVVTRADIYRPDGTILIGPVLRIGGARGTRPGVVAKTEAEDLDAESEPPPTPSSYGMASDDLMDVRDDDDALMDEPSATLITSRSQSRTPVVSETATLSYAALTLSTVTPPQDSSVGGGRSGGGRAGGGGGGGGGGRSS